MYFCLLIEICYNENKDQNETANNIVDFIDLYLITIWLNMHETLSFCQKKKKNGACVFWAPVFFLSFLAGKSRHSKQMLLTEFQ